MWFLNIWTYNVTGGEEKWIIDFVIVVAEIIVKIEVIGDVVVLDVTISFLLGCFGWLEIWRDFVGVIGLIDMIGIGVS